MAIGKKDLTKIAVFGMIAGAATPLLLRLTMWVLNFFGGIVPAFSAKLAEPGTVSVNVRESLTGLNTGLGNKVSAWIVDAFGIGVSVPSWMTTIALGAAGGAILFVAGAYLLDMFGWLKGKPIQKTRNVIFAGNILAGFVLGTFAVPEINIETFNILIAFFVNAAILAFVYVGIDKEAKLGLVPF